MNKAPDISAYFQINPTMTEKIYTLDQEYFPWLSVEATQTNVFQGGT